MKCHRDQNHRITFCTILIVIGLSSCATVKTPPFKWDDTFTAPGTSLMIEEIDRKPGPQGMGTLVSYQIKSTGFSKGEDVSLWRKVGTKYEEIPATIDDNGMVLLWEEYPLYMIHGFAAGEPFPLALISRTSNKRAQAKVIPFPIQAQGNNGCTASLELLSNTGYLFATTLKGFEPGEEIQTITEYKDQKLRVTRKVTEVGEFSYAVVYGEGDNFKVTVTAEGKKCTVKLEYNVGRDALEVQ